MAMGWKPVATVLTIAVALSAGPSISMAEEQAAVPAPSHLPAKKLFGARTDGAPMAARAIGGYAKGCLAGGVALATDGPAWQAMRLSRNRNWGHPDLVRLVERLAIDAKTHDGWSGLLVGDLAQPRGGPMLTGHASHQIGLDADIWFMPMPDRTLTRKEREDLSAVSMLGPDRLSVDAGRFTDTHIALLRRAASYPEVARLFVHPAIKKALCERVGPDRAWLSKVRPMWGHHYHFHIRMTCPADSAGCQNQPTPPDGDGCGDDLAYWYKLLTAPPKPPSRSPVKPKPELTLADLPQECRVVLDAGLSDIPPPVDKAPASKPIEAPKGAIENLVVPVPQRRPS